LLDALDHFTNSQKASVLKSRAKNFFNENLKSLLCIECMPALFSRPGSLWVYKGSMLRADLFGEEGDEDRPVKFWLAVAGVKVLRVAHSHV
jgi:hypothetical protein